MDEYLKIVRSVKPKPNTARRSYEPLNTQQNRTEGTNYPQRASLNPELLSSSRPNTTLINHIPTQSLSQYPMTYSVPYSIPAQNIAPSSINYVHEGFPVITTTTSQFISRPIQSIYQASNNNVAPPASEMFTSTFNQLSQRNRVSQQQESGRKVSFGEHERKGQPKLTEKRNHKVSKKPRRRSQTNKYLSILAGIIVLVSSVVVYKFSNEEKNLTVFCDLNGSGVEGCKPCPPSGECREGRWEGCIKGFKIYKNHCLIDSEVALDQYLDFIDDILAQRRADHRCYPKIKSLMSQEEVEDELHKAFKNDPYFSKHEKLIFERFADKVEDHPHLNKREGRYSTNHKSEPSALCRIKLIWKEKVTVTFVLVWVLLFILSVEYGV